MSEKSEIVAEYSETMLDLVEDLQRQVFEEARERGVSAAIKIEIAFKDHKEKFVETAIFELDDPGM